MEQFNEIQSGCEAGIYQPLLAYIRAKKMGHPVPPYIPKWDVTALHKLCKLACLFHEAGFEMEAGKLCYSLLKLDAFPTLWCKEKEFVEKQVKLAFSQCSTIEPIPHTDPLDVTLLELPDISAALTLTGNGTSLGAIRSKDIEVRAFGPQSSSLKFGIKGKGMDGWIQTFAFPEVWLSMQHECIDDQLKLKLNLVGLRPEEPLSIAFYVKANQCEIGDQIYLPKSLERFKNQTQRVSFENKLQIETANPHNTEVIPLAGEGCYWDSEFLVLFEISPFVSGATFTIRKQF